MSDLHDPELRHRLGRLIGPYPDENAAFAAWQRRVGQARRRRAVAFTTGLAMSLIVAVVAVAALQGRDNRRLVPQKTTESSAAVSTNPSSSKPESSTSESSAPTTAVDSTAPAVTTTPATEDTLTSDTVDMGNGEQPPAAGTTKSGGTTKPTTHTQGPTTTQTVAVTEPQQVADTVDSIGGSVTVRFDGERLKVVDVHENDGFDKHETDWFKTKVTMTFTSKDHKSTVTMWVYTGVIYHDVKESDVGDHQDSFPGGDGSGNPPGGDHSD